MPLTVSPLRFEHHREPLGIGESTPRLSWHIDGAPAGWRQVGAQIEDNTGRRFSFNGSDSVLVPWPFPPLAARERRALRLRVTGADGHRSAWSAWTEVEAGLLEPAYWVAQVIGPNPDGRHAALRAPRARRVFTVSDRTIRRARLYGTAHGVVQFECNGTRLGTDELTPGWTAYADRLRYTTFDVTELLRSGENVLGAWLGDGWFRGRLGWDGGGKRYGTRIGVLAQLEIEYTDGHRAVIGTGPDWQIGPGPIQSADLYDGEFFDARAHDPAWSTLAFAADGWEAATVIADHDPATLVAPDGPPVRVTGTRAVEQVLISRSGTTILDFGQNLVGRLRITVDGPAGTTITLRHAEVLQDGELATAPLRGAAATDRYTLSGAGRQTWAPRFTFHGFRYAEITGWPGEFEPSAVIAEIIGSDLRRTGTLHTSDELLNRLHDNVVWSMRGNFLDVPTDCPQRDERLGWTGDLQVFAPTAAYLYDCAGFLTSWLRDLAVEQARLGQMPMVVPAATPRAAAPQAGWSDAATVVPWTLYQRFGDLELLRRQFPSMTAWVDEAELLAGPDRLWADGFQFGDWLDPTAPTGRPNQGKTFPEIVATAYLARSAGIVADTAQLLGRDDDAARYARLAAEVRTAFQAEYISGAGRLLSDSVTAYALALQFGLIDGVEPRQHAADRLAALVCDNGYRIPTGFLGTPLVLDALSEHGHTDVAYRLLHNTEPPSWLYAVRHGATTIWERWDSLLPDGRVNPSGMTSFNHYAFGAVADWMHRVMCGLAPAAPGYRQLRIAPQPPRHGLTFAHAELDTPYGRAAAGWSIADGALTVTATVPAGTTATVLLPSGYRAVVESGTHRWTEPFELDDEHHELTVDTALYDVAADPRAREVLTGVIVAHVPEATNALDGALNGQGTLTPRQLSEMLPDPAAALADFELGFSALSAGRDIPAFGAEVSTAADARLLTGADFWSTRPGNGIRSLVLSDGPHGLRRQLGGSDHVGLFGSEPATCFPTGSALASSWDPALFRTVGEALGAEARAAGVDVLLGPAINIKRDPRGGRNFEYLSEDPHLTAVLAIEWTRGVQSLGVGTAVKHFAVNNQEADRMTVSADVDERALREIYLHAFEQVITAARPTAVMSAYNAVNGVFCSENRWLLTDLLRDEWGFDGLVVSDWGAIKDRAEALAAGLDLEMPGTGSEGTEAILAAVRNGTIDRGVIDAAVGRLRTLAERTAPRDAVAPVDVDEHHALARRAAADSMVLLRNVDQVLPLPAGTTVAVLGEFAVAPQFQGGGSSHVNPTRIDIPLDELRRALGPESVRYAPGYSDGPDTDGDALCAEAVQLAAAADVAIVFAGLPESEQSEGFDRRDIAMPADHVALIRAVAHVAKKTVVVLFNGGVVTLDPWHDDVDAIIEAWAPGQAAGGAVADVLTGAVNPSGRLAESIPTALAHAPSYLTFPGQRRTSRYGEGVFVGYRYYTTADRAARYPFGHGLSYTHFAQDIVSVESTGADTARVRIAAANIGTVDGAVVLQLYVGPLETQVGRPLRELAAFSKIRLTAGESTIIELDLPRHAFAFWDTERGRWWVSPGGYRIELGRSATDIAAVAELALDGDTEQPRPLTRDSTVKDWLAHPVVGPKLMQTLIGQATADQTAAGAEALRMVEGMPMAPFIRFSGVQLPADTIDALIALSRSAALSPDRGHPRRLAD